VLIREAGCGFWHAAASWRQFVRQGSARVAQPRSRSVLASHSVTTAAPPLAETAFDRTVDAVAGRCPRPARQDRPRADRSRYPALLRLLDGAARRLSGA